MKEFADRPLRVPQEPLAWHLWRMTRWLLELRLVPRLTERRGGWRAPLRALRDGLTASGLAVLLASVLLLLLARRSNPGFDLGPCRGGPVAAGRERRRRPRCGARGCTLVRLGHEVGHRRAAVSRPGAPDQHRPPPGARADAARVARARLAAGWRRPAAR